MNNVENILSQNIYKIKMIKGHIKEFTFRMY